MDVFFQVGYYWVHNDRRLWLWLVRALNERLFCRWEISSDSYHVCVYWICLQPSLSGANVMAYCLRTVQKNRKYIIKISFFLTIPSYVPPYTIPGTLWHLRLSYLRCGRKCIWDTCKHTPHTTSVFVIGSWKIDSSYVCILWTKDKYQNIA